MARDEFRKLPMSNRRVDRLLLFLNSFERDKFLIFNFYFFRSNPMTEYTNLVELLQNRALQQPNHIAYRFLGNT